MDGVRRRVALAVVIGFVLIAARLRRQRIDENRRRRMKVGAFRVHRRAVCSDENGAGKRTVLVTGGAGFLGSEIVALLTGNANVRVVVFDVAPPRRPREDVTYLCGSIVHLDHVRKAFQGVDSVIHCAALLNTLDLETGDLDRVNVVGVSNVVLAARECGVKSLVFTSSAAALLSKSKRDFSNPRAFQTGSEESVPYPSKNDFFEYYGYTKMLGEKMVLAANGGGLATVCLRPGIIFGAKDGKLAERLLQGLDNNIVGLNSLYPLDYVSVKDVARAHVLCEDRLFTDPSRVRGQAFAVGNKRPVDYQAFMSAFGNGAPQPVPLGVVLFSAKLNEWCWRFFRLAPLSTWLTVQSVSNISSGWWFSPEKARAAFGYESRDALQVVQELVDQKKHL